jgi:molybdopterin-guanine dinucleotide biosynthesis protein A
MGRDKALLDWHGMPLLTHMVNLLRHATNDVQVVGRDHLPDRLPGRGPLSGIATALAVSSTEINLIVAVDLPLLTRNFLNFLRSETEHSKQPIVACKIGSYFPLCLGIKRILLPEIEQRLAAGNDSVRGVIENSDSHIISESHVLEAGFKASLFHNINTLEDYLDLRRQTQREI